MDIYVRTVLNGLRPSELPYPLASTKDVQKTVLLLLKTFTTGKEKKLQCAIDHFNYRRKKHNKKFQNKENITADTIVDR